MDLIDTNLKQRGIGNPNPIKLARCLEKLKELHGIAQGGDRKSKGDNLLLKKDICNSVGITEKQMTEYLRLLKLIYMKGEFYNEYNYDLQSYPKWLLC